MEMREENNIVKLVYEEALLQEKRISDVLSRVEDEELSDELNHLLAEWRLFGKKAKRRLQENSFTEEALKDLTAERAAKGTNLRMVPMIDEYVIRSKHPKGEKEDSRDQDADITKAEIMRTEQMAERMKYMIHENRRAGIFATELAKELIDFEELSIKKLKNYVE